MSHKGVPMRKGMLHRPRIDELIREGLQYPLLIMLAGPGYGKTQAMASYLGKCSDDIIWIRLGNTDNQYGYFWNHLIRIINDWDNRFADKLKALSFPDNYSIFEAFIEVLTISIKKEKRLIWVFDDFGVISDKRIINFIRMIADAEIKNFHLILLSNALTKHDSLAFIYGSQYLISGEDLCFTKEEISQLYALHEMVLAEDEHREIEHYTAGWPLPLHLLVLHKCKISNFVSHGGRLTYQIIAKLFEENFFHHYSKSIKKLFVNLSFFHYFTSPLAFALYDGEKAELDKLDNHPFLIYEPATERIYFHQLYHMFLRQKQYLIDQVEQQQLYRTVGDYYAEIGDTLEAINCYRSCEEPIKMLKVICEYIRLEHEVTADNAPFFLEHLDLLPPEVVQAYPVAEHLRAIIHLNLLEFDLAERVLGELEKRLLADGSKEANDLLAEVYAATGSIHLMANQVDFGDYYRKAIHYRPEGSNFHNRSQLSLRDNNIFTLPDNQPGARARMEQAMHEGMPWMSRFIHGSMSGREHLFSAEAAYLTMELDETKQHAYRAIYKAQTQAQHDIVCNSYLLLARTAFLNGDFDEMSRQIDNIVKIAAACDIGVIKEIRNTALGWYYVKLHDDKRVPKSIFTLNDESRPMWTYGRSQLICANYLIHEREYARLTGMLEYPKGLQLQQGISPDRIFRYIMLAIAYYHLDQTDAAMEALQIAYDMSYHNRLITPFIEAQLHMVTLIQLVRGQHGTTFDPEWLDLISEEAAKFAKQAEAVRNAYYQGQTDTMIENPLSQRERKVLQSLSQGLTREEIAKQQYISVNTVKSTIRNIYNKLNASNRAEAVSIAITRKYIKSYRPEQS